MLNLRFEICLLIFLLLFSAVAVLGGNPQEDGEAFLTAAPSNVPSGGGMGKTRLQWKGPADKEVQLWVVNDDGSTSLISKSNSGDIETDFVLPNHTYNYKLFSAEDLKKPLASVTVVATEEISYVSDFHIIYYKLLYRWALPITIVFLLFLGIIYLARRQKAPKTKQFLIVCATLLSIIWATVIIISAPIQPLASEPNPDAQETADAARQLFDGNGYVTYFHDNQAKPPRYPPGFSVALMPFLNFADYPANIFIGTKFYALLYFLLTVLAAWTLCGWAAAALTAIFIGISPFAETYAGLVMSETFTAGIVVLIAILIYKPSLWRVLIAGALAGVLVLTRLQMIICLPALLLALPGIRFRLWAAASVSPFLLGNAILNLITFGNVFKTGYDYWLPEVKPFAPGFALRHYTQGDGPWIIGDWLRGLLLRWICPCNAGGPLVELPNILFYPLVLIGVFWLFAPPFITLYGLWASWKARHETVAKFTLYLVGLDLLLFTFYFWQSSRFVAPAATLLTIYAAVGLAEKLRRFTNSPYAVKREFC